MTGEYVELRRKALEALDRGEAREAFTIFRWTLEYPGRLEDWADALEIFHEPAHRVGGVHQQTAVQIPLLHVGVERVP